MSGNVQRNSLSTSFSIQLEDYVGKIQAKDGKLQLPNGTSINVKLEELSQDKILEIFHGIQTDVEIGLSKDPDNLEKNKQLLQYITNLGVGLKTGDPEALKTASTMVAKLVNKPNVSSDTVLKFFNQLKTVAQDVLMNGDGSIAQPHVALARGSQLVTEWVNSNPQAIKTGKETMSLLIAKKWGLEKEEAGKLLNEVEGIIKKAKDQNLSLQDLENTIDRNLEVILKAAVQKNVKVTPEDRQMLRSASKRIIDLSKKTDNPKEFIEEAQRQAKEIGLSVLNLEEIGPGAVDSTLNYIINNGMDIAELTPEQGEALRKGTDKLMDKLHDQITDLRFEHLDELEQGEHEERHAERTIRLEQTLIEEFQKTAQQVFGENVIIPEEIQEQIKNLAEEMAHTIRDSREGGDLSISETINSSKLLFLVALPGLLTVTKGYNLAARKLEESLPSPILEKAKQERAAGKSSLEVAKTATAEIHKSKVQELAEELSPQKKTETDNIRSFVKTKTSFARTAMFFTEHLRNNIKTILDGSNPKKVGVCSLEVANQVLMGFQKFKNGEKTIEVMTNAGPLNLNDKEAVAAYKKQAKKIIGGNGGRLMSKVNKKGGFDTGVLAFVTRKIAPRGLRRTHNAVKAGMKADSDSTTGIGVSIPEKTPQSIKDYIAESPVFPIIKFCLENSGKGTDAEKAMESNELLNFVEEHHEVLTLMMMESLTTEMVNICANKSETRAESFNTELGNTTNLAVQTFAPKEAAPLAGVAGKAAGFAVSQAAADTALTAISEQWRTWIARGG